MNIRDFEYVVAVHDHQHFGRAAEACNVSQPALSGQIRKLEEHLGLEIFERTKRSVRTTAAGETIVAKARELLRMAEDIRETANSLRDPLSGALRLGAIPTIAPYLTPIFIPSLMRALPQVELKLAERFTRDLEAALVGGDIDCAIIATEPSLPQLDSIPLYDEPFWIALPKGHPLGDQDDIDIREIKAEQLLLLSDGHCLREQVLSFYTGQVDTSPQVSTEETSLTTILALVSGGLGITLVPAMSVSGPWVTDAGITVRQESSGHAERRVRLAFRRSFPRRALLERVADVIAAIVPNTVTPQRR